MVWRTEGADEVGHLPASPSSSHCGHFAPFLSPPNRSCCAYLQNIYIYWTVSTSYLVIGQPQVRYNDFFANDSDYSDGSSSFKGNSKVKRQCKQHIWFIKSLCRSCSEACATHLLERRDKNKEVLDKEHWLRQIYDKHLGNPPPKIGSTPAPTITNGSTVVQIIT